MNSLCGLTGQQRTTGYQSLPPSRKWTGLAAGRKACDLAVPQSGALSTPRELGGFVSRGLHPGAGPFHPVSPVGPASEFVSFSSRKEQTGPTLIQRGLRAPAWDGRKWACGAGRTSYHLRATLLPPLSHPHLLPLLVVKPCKLNLRFHHVCLLEDFSKYEADTKAKSCLHCLRSG